MIFRTCRLKQTILYTLAAASILFVFSFSVYAHYRHQLYAAVDADLLKEAKHRSSSDLDPNDLAENESILKKVGSQYYEVSKHNGTMSLLPMNGGNKAWPVKRALLLAAFQGEPQLDSVRRAGVNYRILYYPIREDTVLRTGESLENIEEQSRGLLRLFLLYAPFVLVITYALSWFLAGSIIAPVLKMKSLTEKVRQSKSITKIEMIPMGKEMDDLVVLMNEMLEGLHLSVEFQGRFTSDVSHEIRSPLTSLRGSIEVALRKKRSPEEYEEILKKNLSDIVRLSKITDNLLFLSRADHHILELRKQRFDLNLLLHTAVDRMRYNSSAAGIALHEHYSDGLELHGDADLLDQAFSNLIDNAIKYTHKGGEVVIKTEQDADKITVSVSDTGIGIPESELPYVFDRFHRVNKERSRKLGGTGLGLSITKWIINAHNGEISVKSSPGKGSDFVVTFTRARDLIQS